MKILIYTASSIFNPQFGIQMDNAIDYAKKGYDVVFCHCDGIMKACPANLYQNKALCKVCSIGFKAGLKNLPNNVRIVKLRELNIERSYIWKSFESVADIKSYKYKGVEVGFGVLSPVISETKNPNPKFTSRFLNSINQLLKESESMVDAAEMLIQKEKPDIILFFNGRVFDSKVFCNLAKNANIPFIATENVGGIRADSEYRIVKFSNRVPHDPRVPYDNCLASWDKSTKTYDEKVKMGTDFFERRRNGIVAGDYVYTSSQIQGQLPLSYDKRKKNIVVFISSENEFSSVSNEIDGYYLFNSQYDAIKYIADNLNDDNFHIYVRIHPNMKGLNVYYHKRLYDLASHNNVTVIAPEDSISSYSLMDIAYNIVVFGSTIGAEAIFWGKPVVLLGFAAYYYWDACQIPLQLSDVIGMIKTPLVYSNGREMAIKYGYFFLENSLAEKAKYINITPMKKTVLGRSIYVYDYLKIWGSSMLYRFLYVFNTRITVKLFGNNITIPV